MSAQDPDDDWDPTGYYRRRAGRQDEGVRRFIVWIRWLLIFVFSMILFSAFCRLAMAAPAVDLEAACPSSKPGTETSCRIFNQGLLYYETNKEISFSWISPTVDVEGKPVDSALIVNQFQAVKFPPTDPPAVSLKVDTTPGNQTATWTPTRAGLYFVRVRACAANIPQDGKPVGEYIPEKLPDGRWALCSTWGNSFDPETAGPELWPRGFILSIKLTAPTGGAID